MKLSLFVRFENEMASYYAFYLNKTKFPVLKVLEPSNIQKDVISCTVF